jgi:hypothetical protein
MNKWIILITTAVDNLVCPFSEAQKEYRKNLYSKQIHRWINETKYDIVVVESSGYEFPDIQHERLHKINFIIDNKLPSSSQYEAVSILYALDKINDSEFYNNCSHILKVTGRYFLNDIENVLNKTEQHKDLYTQIHCNHVIKWQNSEYYGIKKELYHSFAEKIKNEPILMEHGLYTFSSDKNIQHIGPFLNDVARGGDNMLIKNL